MLRRGRRAYKAVEDRVGPMLPRPIRNVWRTTIGRPPLPEAPGLTASGGAAAARLATPGDVEGHPSSAQALTWDVVCFPIIAWRFRCQRPQHLMRELAYAGHRVFWIDPESLRDGRRLLPGSREPGVRELGERLFEVELAALAPRDHFKEALTTEETFALLRSLEQLARHFGIVSAVAVAQLPFWAPLASAAAQRLGWRLVYDCMDEHGGFSSNEPAMLAGERGLLARSDLVVATSRPLLEKARPVARQALLVPNACELEHFSAARGRVEPPSDVAWLSRPVVGYVGAISEWFDFDLLRDAVARHPDWQFVLIGSTWGAPDHRDLAARSNVHLLGEKPYARLPAYVAQMDVCCIPFQISPLTRATNPVKLYEYLAAGKPVVASPLPELEPHRGLVALAATPAEFTVALERALADDSPESAEARIAFARANDWRARAATLATAVEATFPLASIVVVTWNNLELTRRCLASVLADRSWPRFEIVAVDNGSSDGTPELLRELGAREPRLKLLLNGENLGFAAANNQGIAVAKGEVVVLLNNDTEVTRGWLARLVRVLDVEPQIGVVGPVTNSVYNEARVEVSERELADLPRFADRWARAHAGNLYPIKILAMFCMAGRRRVFDEVGPLDERYRIGMLEDDDYAHRVRLAGYRVACAEEVFVFHAGQASFRKLGAEGKDALQAENQRRFEEKWNVAWRPYLGSRHESRRWRDEVDHLLLRFGANGPTVVFVPERRWSPDAPQAAERLAAAFARHGHLVVYCLEPPASLDGHGLVEVEPRLFLSNVPLESFENLRGAIAVARATSSFEIAYFPEARVVYEVASLHDLPPPRRESAHRAHASLVESAAAVLCEAALATPELRAARPDLLVLPPPMAVSDDSSVAAEADSAAAFARLAATIAARTARSNDARA